MWTKCFVGFLPSNSKIKGPKGYQCVHFDRLKPYQGENREFQSEAPLSQWFTEQQLIPEDPPPRTPAAMELLDDDEEEQQLDGQANEDQPEVAPAADPPAVTPAADPPPGHRYPARERRAPQPQTITDRTFNFERREWCNVIVTSLLRRDKCASSRTYIAVYIFVYWHSCICVC